MTGGSSVDFACVALVDPAGRVLMQERDEHARKWPNQWCFPGGSAEPGESARDCAARELEEETGVRVPPAELVSLGQYVMDVPGDRSYRWECFAVRTDLGQHEVECHEGRQMLFRPLEDFGRIDLVPTSEQALGDLRAWIGANPPRLGERRFAGVLLRDLRGYVLLQERDEHARIDPECWGLPGGHVEPGENFAQAAPRELEEETGLRLAEPPAFWREFVVDHRAAHGTWDRMQVFTATADLTDDDVDCREGRRFVFVDPDVALELPLTVAADQILRRLES